MNLDRNIEIMNISLNKYSSNIAHFELYGWFQCVWRTDGRTDTIIKVSTVNLDQSLRNINILLNRFVWKTVCCRDITKISKGVRDGRRTDKVIHRGASPLKRNHQSYFTVFSFSLSLSLSFTICLSFSLSLFLFVYLPFPLSVCLSLFLYLSLCLSVFINVDLRKRPTSPLKRIYQACIP